MVEMKENVIRLFSSPLPPLLANLLRHPSASLSCILQLAFNSKSMPEPRGRGIDHSCPHQAPRFELTAAHKWTMPCVLDAVATIYINLPKTNGQSAVQTRHAGHILSLHTGTEAKRWAPWGVGAWRRGAMPAIGAKVLALAGFVQAMLKKKAYNKKDSSCFQSGLNCEGTLLPARQISLRERAVSHSSVCACTPQKGSRNPILN